jgi:hypothetical protein
MSTAEPAHAQAVDLLKRAAKIDRMVTISIYGLVEFVLRASTRRGASQATTSLC